MKFDIFQTLSHSSFEGIGSGGTMYSQLTLFGRELWIIRGNTDYVLATHMSGIFGSSSVRCSRTCSPQHQFRHKPRYCKAVDSKVVGNLLMGSSLAPSSDNDLLLFRGEITITVRPGHCPKTMQEVVHKNNRV